MISHTLIDAATASPARLVFPSGDWSIDPNLTFMNHGSYGSVPRAVQRAQDEARARMERDPVRFFKFDLEKLMDGVRASLAAFFNCRAADLAPVPNATIGLATILANIDLKPGDEILITDHEYGSLTNELERVCARTGARVVKVNIPFPICDANGGSGGVAERFLAGLSDRTRIGFISHITSATSLVFPVAAVVDEFNRRGIDIVVDGAHTPGQIPVDLTGLKATYWVGSGHKWLSAPKGTGFLYVRPDKQAGFRPLSLSSRANKVRPDRALYLRDFDYMGTDDYSGMLAVPTAISTLGSLLEGGWPALLRHNHELALRGRDVVCGMLRMDAPAPDTMVGSMVTIPIPDPDATLLNRPTCYDDALQDELFNNHGVVAPVWRFGDANTRVVRMSAQLYNTVEHFERLGHALATELARERRDQAPLWRTASDIRRAIAG